MSSRLLLKTSNKKSIQRAVGKLSDAEQSELLHMIAQFSEAAFRRGMQQGVTFAHAGAKHGLCGKSLEREVFRLRYETSISSAKEVFEDVQARKWRLVPRKVMDARDNTKGRLHVEHSGILPDFGFSNAAVKSLAD